MTSPFVEQNSAPALNHTFFLHGALRSAPCISALRTQASFSAAKSINTHTLYLETTDSRYSLCVFILLAALNDACVLSAEIQGADLNAPYKNNVWFRAGAEFCSTKGLVIVIVRFIYGLNNDGYVWQSQLIQTMSDLGFTS